MYAYYNFGIINLVYDLVLQFSFFFSLKIKIKN